MTITHIRDPRPPNLETLVRGFTLILEGLGLDQQSTHLVGTPQRAARAWFDELCKGLTAPAPDITTFPSKADEMVILQHIPIRSLCAHHLLPFFGEATIGYIPGADRLLGLSKLSRIANYWARRPQVQEILTAQIADHVASVVVNEKKGTGGAGVIIRATHLCMTLRGVNHSGEMTTSAMRGIFLTKPHVRTEFLQLANA